MVVCVEVLEAGVDLRGEGCRTLRIVLLLLNVCVLGMGNTTHTRCECGTVREGNQVRGVGRFIYVWWESVCTEVLPGGCHGKVLSISRPESDISGATLSAIYTTGENFMAGNASDHEDHQFKPLRLHERAAHPKLMYRKYCGESRTLVKMVIR